jgi:hypothetical protein
MMERSPRSSADEAARRRRWALAACAAAGVVGSLTSPWRAPAAALGRPPRLAAQQGCELWVGTSRGNDPSTLLEVRLCPAAGPGALTGVLQWSSEVSGWNRRALVGRAEGARISLRDERILEERPNAGWRFCIAEWYELTRAGDRLTGRYHSTDCRDDGQVDLRLVPAPPGSPPVVPGPVPAAPDPSAPDPSPPRPRPPAPGEPGPVASLPAPAEPGPPALPPTPPPAREASGCGWFR